MKGKGIIQKSRKRINLSYAHLLGFNRRTKILNDNLKSAVLVNNDCRVVELLEKGADINCINKMKQTPLHLAVSNGYSSLVRILLDYGADPSLKDAAGNTSLHLASSLGNALIVKDLIAHGADIKSKDMRGVSPVQLAQERLRTLSSYFQTAPLEKTLFQEQINAIVANLLETIDKSQIQQVEALNAQMLTLEPNDYISTLLNQLANLSL